MLALSATTRIFVAVAPVDLRRGFDGLSAYVQTVLDRQVLEGGLFVFTNRRKNRLRLLWWDGSGLWLATKRLERDSFDWPTADGAAASLRAEQLSARITARRCSAWVSMRGRSRMGSKAASFDAVV